MGKNVGEPEGIPVGRDVVGGVGTVGIPVGRNVGRGDGRDVVGRRVGEVVG